MASYPNLKIRLAGQDILGYMQGLQINQDTDGHHSFSVTLSANDMSRNFIGSAGDMYKKLLGSTLSVEDLFEGVVTSVNLSRSKGGMSVIVVNGNSPTILMEDGTNTRSFSEQSLQQIVDTILSDYKDKLGELSINATYKPKLDYIVQYRESNFAFINRLAARYSEWFFSDGKKLIFGKPGKGNVIRLKLGDGITNFTIAMRAIPMNFKLLGYDYKNHKTLKDEPNDPGLQHEYAKIAYDKSKKDIFPKKPQLPINMSMTQEDLDHISELRQNVYLDGLVTLSASSSNAELRVGSVVEIVDERDGLLSIGNDKYGQYVITHLTHEFGTRGESYSNHFQGIPADAHIPPLSVSADPPPCEMQEAKVKENNDPDGMGRVKVQFIWQEEKNLTTPWIRVTSPQGGGDKGFYFLPEKDDQVLIAFEHDHPEHPYVLTGTYHGKSKPHNHDPNNYKKSWKTKGGHQILMNDEKGKESMALSSPTDFSASAGGGNMELSAKSKITIKSSGGDITINTPSDISVGADGSITIKAKGDVTIEATGDMNLKATNINLDGKAGISLQAPKIDIAAKAELNASGAKVSIEGKASTAVSGAMLDLKGTAMANLSGAMVKIN